MFACVVAALEGAGAVIKHVIVAQALAADAAIFAIAEVMRTGHMTDRALACGGKFVVTLLPADGALTVFVGTMPAIYPTDRTFSLLVVLLVRACHTAEHAVGV